jgi:hypothetical protein
MGQTGNWPARQWETPTATGWVDAELRLQVFRARVFDEVLRDIARKIRALGMESVWASHADEAKALGGPLEQEHARFNELIANALRKFS